MLLQKWSPQCWVEGKDHLPRPTGNALPNAALCAAKLHCCLVVIMTLRTFSAGLLFSQAIASLTKACGYASLSLNFNRSSSAHETSMSRSFQMVWHTICGVDPPGTSATPPAFYLPQTCSRCTVWLSRSLMKSQLDWPQSVLPSSYMVKSFPLFQVINFIFVCLSKFEAPFGLYSKWKMFWMSALLYGAFWQLWSPEDTYLKIQIFAWPCFCNM